MKKIYYLIISFIISFISVVLLLELVDMPYHSAISIICNSTTIITDSTVKVTPGFGKTIITVGPGYFSSMSKLYAARTSPFSEFMMNDTIELSLDEINWKIIPLYSSSDNLTDVNMLQYIGDINLNQFKVPLYERCTLPPLNLPTDLSREQVDNSSTENLLFEPVYTNRDYVIIILTFFTLFGVCYSILNSTFCNKKSLPENISSYMSRQNI